MSTEDSKDTLLSNNTRAIVRSKEGYWKVSGRCRTWRITI